LLSEPIDIYFFYAGIFLLALFLLFMRRPERPGMRLRLKGKTSTEKSPVPKEESAPLPFKRPDGTVERPLNVMFNYNGHSWDAYEVLGLPAGSNIESTDAAYRKSIATVEAESREFIEAAYRAIHAQWHSYNKAAGGN